MVSLRNELQGILAGDEENINDWLNDHGEDFKNLIERREDILDRFDTANDEERNTILEEVKKAIYH